VKREGPIFMKSNVAQNRLLIELACECLTNSGFKNVARNKDQGTFPDAYATALDGTTGIEYLVGITGRVETKAEGDWDPLFNLVRSDEDRRKARALAKSTNKRLAFVAIALRRSDGSYAAYFGELDPIGFPRSLPMLPPDRSGYQQIASYTPDARVKELLAA
jgi:hypothetical protein